VRGGENCRGCWRRLASWLGGTSVDRLDATSSPAVALYWRGGTEGKVRKAAVWKFSGFRALKSGSIVVNHQDACTDVQLQRVIYRLGEEGLGLLGFMVQSCHSCYYLHSCAHMRMLSCAGLLESSVALDLRDHGVCLHAERRVANTGPLYHPALRAPLDWCNTLAVLVCSAALEVADHEVVAQAEYSGHTSTSISRKQIRWERGAIL
jgi:hypothetical protein